MWCGHWYDNVLAFCSEECKEAWRANKVAEEPMEDVGLLWPNAIETGTPPVMAKWDSDEEMENPYVQTEGEESS
jgi:hypothetical protein